MSAAQEADRSRRGGGFRPPFPLATQEDLMYRLAFLAVVVALIGAAAFPAAAQNPESGPPPFALNEKCGPYLVYVSSYRGDNAMRSALELVGELRNDYRVNAYWYSRTEQLRAEQERELERLRHLYPNQKLKRVRIPDEIAVLVGDYRSFEAASDAVARLRNMPAPKKAMTPTLAIAYQKAGAVRDNDLSKVTGQVASVNPFRSAFPLRNPMLPKEESGTQAKFDPLWIELNAAEPYSMLKNKGNYTLVVKTFQGAMTVGGRRGKDSVFNQQAPVIGGVSVDPVLQRQLEQMRKASGWDLDAAALQARNLAEILRHRSLNYEAWVLHTRDCSYVSVGSFKDRNDPEIEKLKRLLAGQSFGIVKLIGDPLLVEVPKQP